VERRPLETRWFWPTLVLSCISIVAVVFSCWELVENRFFRDVDYVTLHYLYITRGMASSLILATWAAWYVLRQRRRSEEELRRSREHYRNLLEASPGAVVLYDTALRVTEWNATAERLYGFDRGDVLGRPLQTVPEEKEPELRDLLRRVEAGESILDVETQRQDHHGDRFDVQLSLLPFHDTSGQGSFLEVTTDIRERVRLRRTLIEIEKLTSMGKMAAGTAHHLNTPLAAMLLRVQMMRERMQGDTRTAELQQLESNIAFCQHFVRRLLEFSRHPAAEKQPENVERLLESMVSFFTPSLHAKRAEVRLDFAAADGMCVFADRNLLEALLSSLLGNALDAISEGGTIAVGCRRLSAERLEIRVGDDGCGIAPADLPRVFEPFFTTKGPGRGTGLGLAIARNITLEHGGSIRLENGPGRGTVAIVELPVWRPDRAQEGVRA
jgi:PAS domain S-box-containing protein